MQNRTAALKERSKLPGHDYPDAEVSWQLNDVNLTITVQRSWSLPLAGLIPDDIVGAHAWNKLDYLSGLQWLDEDVNPLCAEIMALTEHMGPELIERAMLAMAAACTVVRIAEEDSRPKPDGERADARNMGLPV